MKGEREMIDQQRTASDPLPPIIIHTCSHPHPHSRFDFPHKRTAQLIPFPYVTLSLRCSFAGLYVNPLNWSCTVSLRCESSTTES